MDLNRVAVFVRVAELGSFTGAAAALGAPKSSVSRSVARLEEELGVRLLQRTTRRLHLTDAGRAYFERARAALAGLEEATAQAAEMGSEPRGTVRVTAPVDIGVGFLADVVARFARKHPAIEVDVSLTARKVDLVQEGFDLAVRAGPLGDSSLVARKLGMPELGLYASAAYLRKRGRPKAVSDLAHHDCVLFAPLRPRGTWRLVGPNGEETAIVHGQLRADDLSFVHSAVRAGAGIGPALPSLVASSRDGDALVRVLPAYAFFGAPLHLVAPSNRLEPARVALFRAFVVDAFAKICGRTGEAREAGDAGEDAGDGQPRRSRRRRK